ncbi:hypothetical protein K431DRAFT_93847 [Polychaeton citri CBS 116435]|uniref:Uncharacterized protein n=1 Tax=Polychaeton citri CBS 116435 TaxID=1314669 RepID=A0A9P4ULR2_9PEZI|nr:hypothetical protein K431DRAFT_93847 [Polychaeton citri CBS 116435]
MKNFNTNQDLDNNVSNISNADSTDHSAIPNCRHTVDAWPVMRPFATYPVQHQLNSIREPQDEGVLTSHQTPSMQHFMETTPYHTTIEQRLGERKAPPNYLSLEELVNSHQRCDSQLPASTQSLKTPPMVFHRGGHSLGLPECKFTGMCKTRGKASRSSVRHSPYGRNGRSEDQPTGTVATLVTRSLPPGAPMARIQVPAWKPVSSGHLAPGQVQSMSSQPQFYSDVPDARWKPFSSSFEMDPRLSSARAQNSAVPSLERCDQAQAVMIAMTVGEFKATIREAVRDAMKLVDNGQLEAKVSSSEFVELVGNDQKDLRPSATD